ncbi:GPW/gp25 family protein [Niabella drilacis]|uniref:Gene 25-like lysozyme n=1 Tax=Niabella drilacis (strain DSM 25811 / CCM 8410 / CCUG 62505 / LMG 26954 / E90) TaxID=1285928 RepID=A0A1G6Z917_NIADE|nr:GPW/gp25 family protein [Niabella drilacis]SDD99011.1 Gene 25-like lysozyme [Niabella drilacis]
MKEYLKLPLRFDQFFDKKKLPSCGLADSIYRNLHLLITTVPGENKNDETYGASFWETDYDIHLDNDSRKELIVGNLKKQIALYEKRIHNVEVTVDVKLAVLKTQSADLPRRKIEITVNGIIRKTLEPFRFQTGLFIGPLTLD